MRYGHFPLSDLGPIAVGRTVARKAANRPYRLVLDGTAVRIHWQRPAGQGGKTMEPRVFDLKGALR